MVCRFKEEAEGSIADMKQQVAAAHQERHALEQQAKDQVTPAVSPFFCSQPVCLCIPYPQAKMLLPHRQ